MKALSLIIALLAIPLAGMAKESPGKKTDTEGPPPNANASQSNAPLISYVPIPPIPVSATVAGGSSPTYPNTDMEMVLNAFDSDGKITYGVGTADIKYARYEQIIDFTKYFVVPLTMDDGTCVFLHVGFVYRAKANFKIIKGGLDTGALFSLGVKASSEKIDGRISFALYGLNSTEAHTLLPAPDKLSKEKIEEYFRSLGTVKFIANQQGAANSIEPQIIAVSPNGHTIDAIVKKIYQTPTLLNNTTGMTVKLL